MSRSGSLRCSACDEFLGRAPRARVSVDRPFEECPRCRAVVAREGASEWDLLAARPRLIWLAERMTPVLAIGATPGLVTWAMGLRRPSSAAVSWTDEPLLVLVVGLVVAFLVGATSVQKRIQRSRSRMNDPMYRARLAAFERRTMSADPT